MPEEGIRDIIWIVGSMDSTTSVDAMTGAKRFLIQPQIEPRILTHPARNRETLLMSYTGFLMHNWRSHTPIFVESPVSFMAWIAETALGLICGLEAYSYECKQNIFSGICVNLYKDEAQTALFKDLVHTAQ
jgi:hypothetical protein